MHFNLVNLTGQDLNIFNEEGKALYIPPSGNAKLVSTHIFVGEANNFPLYKTMVTGLPNGDGFQTIFIVSHEVRATLPSRYDVASPGPIVRGSDGQPIGCLGLVLTR